MKFKMRKTNKETEASVSMTNCPKDSNSSNSDIDNNKGNGNGKLKYKHATTKVIITEANDNNTDITIENNIEGTSIVELKRLQRSSSDNNNDDDDELTRVYKRRFFILTLFCAHSAINSFQWIQYSSITNILSSYYGASNIQLNLTSLVYMITYIPFIIHTSLLIEKVGLRRAAMFGTIGTTLGAGIKWWLGGNATLSSFYCLLAGQTIVALSQLFIISVPPLLAAVWFPDNQVSTATSLGVFGNQVGIAAGFIVPPLLVRATHVATKDELGDDINLLARFTFLASLSVCVVSFLFFQDKPSKPPGSASLHMQRNKLACETTLSSSSSSLSTTTRDQSTGQNNSNCATILKLCSDLDFILLVLSYGINVGCFYAISTVLNQMLALKWPELSDLAGQLGLLLVVSGMIGSVICGYILDKTHAYKKTVSVTYLLSLLSVVSFALVLAVSHSTLPLYLVITILGFFMTGYLPLGFEYAAETTYPHQANTPAGLLNLSAQVFGLIFTYSTSLIVDSNGNLIANIFLAVCLIIGLILTILMKENLRRQRAIAEEGRNV